MSLPVVTHIALTVPALRTAEEFYCALFGLSVAFREAKTAAGLATLPPGLDWTEAERAGVKLDQIMLHRPGFNLALETGESGNVGPLSQFGVQWSEADLARLRATAPECGCQVLAERADLFVFRDPFGVQWEITTNAYDDPARYSNGVRNGRWISIR